MLICPKCKKEYQDRFSVYCDCGTQLVEQIEEAKKDDNDRIVDNLNCLKGFGNISAQRAITILFYLGIIPLFISSIMFGKNINLYLASNYASEVDYLPLVIFLGSIYFIFGIMIWKIICELLIIIFRYFETYVQKNKR